MGKSGSGLVIYQQDNIEIVISTSEIKLLISVDWSLKIKIVICILIWMYPKSSLAILKRFYVLESNSQKPEPQKIDIENNQSNYNYHCHAFS